MSFLYIKNQILDFPVTGHPFKNFFLKKTDSDMWVVLFFLMLRPTQLDFLFFAILYLV